MVKKDGIEQLLKLARGVARDRRAKQSETVCYRRQAHTQV
jgi:hypothetical protein